VMVLLLTLSLEGKMFIEF